MEPSEPGPPAVMGTPIILKDVVPAPDGETEAQAEGILDPEPAPEANAESEPEQQPPPKGPYPPQTPEALAEHVPGVEPSV